MSTDAFTFPQNATVGMVLARIASEDEDFVRYRGQHPYILDKDDRPVGVVPLLLKRFGQDPAAASGPLLTTITDMAGFFLVLSLASAFMPLLV